MLEETVHVLVVAGETSGDFHGSSLLRNLKRLNSQLDFFGIGGDRMKKEGLSLIEHVDNVSVVGFTEVIRRYSFLREVFRRLLQVTAKIRPARAILIDYPGFNLRLAKDLKKQGIPITYFISPQLWAWREKRINVIRECVDQVLNIFPFEEEWFRERGISATYVGNPLMDQTDPEMSKQKFIKTYGFNEKNLIIALFPGSRQQEVNRHLPIMIEALQLLKNRGFKVEGVIGRAPGINLDDYSVKNIPVVEKNPQIVLVHSDVGVIASGTASLEAAIYGTPAVVIYKTSAISWLLVRSLARVPFVSMTNLVAKHEVLPEILQNKLTAQNIADTVQPLLESKSLRNTMRQELFKVKEKLGSPGATKRAAYLINERVLSERGNI